MRSLVRRAVRLPVRPISSLIAMLIAAEVVLGAPTAVAQTQTFSNATPITINDADVDGPGLAAPYPSEIPVPGPSGVVQKVTVTLTNFGHTFPEDVDILLVGPGGQTVVLQSDAGAGLPVSNVTLTFDDAAAGPLPEFEDPIVSGTYKPTNYSQNGTPDAFAPPAPAGPYGSALSVFNGTNPSGTWKLFVIDEFEGDTGTIAGGWSLTITTQALGALVGQVTARPTSPVETSPVGGGPATGGAVPLPGVQVIVKTLGGQPAGSAMTDAQGRYRVPLPAGTFRVTLGSLSGLQFAKSLPATVTIAAESDTRLDISVDTGIR